MPVPCAHLANIHDILHCTPKKGGLENPINPSMSVSTVTNSCTYLLKNTLISHKILSPRHVSDHTRIHPQGPIIKSWLKYLQVHGASLYSWYCGCIGELQCVNTDYMDLLHEPVNTLARIW